ncbi:MAG: hypothetical protein NBV67_11860, partial [Tagaea sp.]|nr:hypothetical protein [Tagaea sp.]
AVAGGLQGVRTVAGLTSQQGAAQGLAAGAQTPGGGAFQPGALMTFEQLRSINTGTAEFNPMTVTMTKTAGPTTQTVSYTFRFNYDFGARQTFGANVSINVQGAGAMTQGVGTFPLLSNPFGTKTGPAIVTENNITVPTLGGMASVTGDMLNGQTRVFGAIKHTVTYAQAGNSFQGSGTTLRK